VWKLSIEHPNCLLFTCGAARWPCPICRGCQPPEASTLLELFGDPLIDLFLTDQFTAVRLAKTSLDVVKQVKPIQGVFGASVPSHWPKNLPPALMGLEDNPAAGRPIAEYQKIVEKHLVEKHGLLRIADVLNGFFRKHIVTIKQSRVAGFNGHSHRLPCGFEAGSGKIQAAIAEIDSEKEERCGRNPSGSASSRSRCWPSLLGIRETHGARFKLDTTLFTEPVAFIDPATASCAGHNSPPRVAQRVLLQRLVSWHRRAPSV